MNFNYISVRSKKLKSSATIVFDRNWPFSFFSRQFSFSVKNFEQNFESDMAQKCDFSEQRLAWNLLTDVTDVA